MCAGLDSQRCPNRPDGNVNNDLAQKQRAPPNRSPQEELLFSELGREVRVTSRAVSLRSARPKRGRVEGAIAARSRARKAAD